MGNDETGPYGAFTRFVPGIDTGMHIHINDARIAIIKGASLYKDASGEKRIGPVDSIWIPGGGETLERGDANGGTRFSVESSGKFDLIPLN